MKGELSGDNISFWENGLKKQQGTFVNGKENGTFTYYSPDNKDSSELIYENGKPMDGVSSEWWKNGQIWVVKTWKDGLCQGETLWWENGAMMREDLYEKGEKYQSKLGIMMVLKGNLNLKNLQRDIMINLDELLKELESNKEIEFERLKKNS